MARPSLAQLNAEFSAHGFELVKAADYFYFAKLPSAPDDALEALDPDDVHLISFKQWPISRWRAAMADVAEGLKRIRAGKAA